MELTAELVCRFRLRDPSHLRSICKLSRYYENIKYDNVKTCNPDTVCDPAVSLLFLLNVSDGKLHIQSIDCKIPPNVLAQQSENLLIIFLTSLYVLLFSLLSAVWRRLPARLHNSPAAKIEAESKILDIT